MSLSLKFLKVTKMMHKSFENIFRGGAEHRRMMLPEASAAILKVASQCADISNLAAKNISCKWSEPAMINANYTKNDLLTEYDKRMNQWIKEAAMEKNKSRPRIAFPRTTVAQKNGYRAAIREETKLMETIHRYTELTANNTIETRVENCWEIVMQTAVLISTLIELADEKALSSSNQCLSATVTNYKKQVTVDLASKEQKSEILHRLQATNKIAYSIVLGLSNGHLYVISYADDTKNYCGFIFVDTPVHIAATSCKDARITYIETLQGHRKSPLARRLVHWIQTTARDSGYKSLYSTTIVPDTAFWVQCGFKVQDAVDSEKTFEVVKKLVIYDMNPMRIENLVN
jgi:tRNA threonylcarbamoyladenosine modification (KEOPS) complex Cgi121 subunit